MKMRITKLVEVAVEVPERCPHCGASFTDARSPQLREVNVEQTTRFVGSASSDGTEFHLDVEGVGRTMHRPSELHFVAFECDGGDAVITGDVDEPVEDCAAPLHS